MIDDSPEAFERLRQSLAATRLEHRALTRDCRAVRVPSGEEAELERDDEVTLIRETGGAYIVQVPALGGEYRIDSDDADALGKARPIDESARSGGSSSSGDTNLDARIRERLSEVYDPELPVNIVDLGLIYATQAIEIAPERYRVEIEMTLTTPQCGMGRMIARDIERSVSALVEVDEVETRIVWEPEWSPHKISPEGRAKLGID
jgi:probable FeS assembly SUF system protein SufT